MTTAQITAKVLGRCGLKSLSAVPEYESKELAGNRTGIAPGVPYLSLTEIANNDGNYSAVGTIPENQYCDHECNFIRKLESDEAGWQAAVDWSMPRWEAWLKSQPKVIEGKIQFGPMATKIESDSPTKLVNEIGK